MFFYVLFRLAAQRFQWRKRLHMLCIGAVSMGVSGLLRLACNDTTLPSLRADEVSVAIHSYHCKSRRFCLKANNPWIANYIFATAKAAVKMEGFDLPLSILHLNISLHESVRKKLEAYIFV
jgi:hypothetical protein